MFKSKQETMSANVDQRIWRYYIETIFEKICTTDRSEDGDSIRVSGKSEIYRVKNSVVRFRPGQ